MLFIPERLIFVRYLSPAVHIMLTFYLLALKILTSRIPPSSVTKDVLARPYISTALEIAIADGDIKLCEALLEQVHSLQGTCKDGDIPVLTACKLGYPRVAEILIEHGALTDGQVSDKDAVTYGFTPLHLAALYGYESLLKKILSTRRPARAQAVKPIHIAALNGHYQCVRLLLKHEQDTKSMVEAKANKPSSNNHTGPFLVLEASPYPKVIIYGGTPLYYASLRGHTKAVRELLLAGSNLEATGDDGDTALHCAAENGHANVMKLLVAAGSNLEATDDYGYTALHWAAKNGHANIMKLLIAAGSNINSISFNELTPIMLAALVDCQSAVRLLYESGADFNVRDRIGKDALFLAAEKGNTKLVSLLNKMGANLKTRTSSGWEGIRSLISKIKDEESCVKLLPEDDTNSHPMFGNLLSAAVLFRKLHVAKE